MALTETPGKLAASKSLEFEGFRNRAGLDSFVEDSVTKLLEQLNEALAA
jgi:hypothetical protein